MLVLGVVVAVFGAGYLLRLPVTAEVTAGWIQTTSRYAIRRLLAHAAARRAADAAYEAAYQAEWDRLEAM
jgi:hypothetical protein